MKDLILEMYIKEKLFLLKEEDEYLQLSSNGPDNKGPTFGQLKSFAKIKNTVDEIMKKGQVGPINVFKLGLNFVAHYSGVDFVKKTVKDAGIDLESIGVDDQSIESGIRSIEKAFGFGFSNMNPTQILAKCYGINSDSGLENIRVPGNVSNLIDDRVEKAFFKELWPIILKKNDDEVIPEDWLLGELYKFTNRTKEIEGAWDEVG